MQKILGKSKQRQIIVVILPKPNKKAKKARFNIFVSGYIISRYPVIQPNSYVPYRV